MVLIAENITVQTEHGEITQEGKIHGIEKVTPNEFRIAENAEIMMPYAAPGITSGRIGSNSNNFCCADHIHPYSSEWINDVDIQNISNTITAARDTVDRVLSNKSFIFFSKLIKAGGAFVSILVVMMAGSAPYTAAFINLIIGIINIMYDLGIKEIDIDGVIYGSQLIIQMIENAYGIN